MRFFTAIIILFYSSSTLHAQSDTDSFVLGERFIEYASYNSGGEEGLQTFIYSNLTYPNAAFNMNITGTVIATFVIDSVGMVSEIKPVGRVIGYGLEEEAIRLISLTSGKWCPTKQFGRFVQMKYRIPIKFEI